MGFLLNFAFANNFYIYASGFSGTLLKTDPLGLYNYGKVLKNKYEVGALAVNDFNFKNFFKLHSSTRLFILGSNYTQEKYSKDSYLYIDELYFNAIVDKYGTFIPSVGRKKVSYDVSYLYSVACLYTCNAKSYGNFFDKQLETFGQDLVDLKYISNFATLYFAYIPKIMQENTNLLKNNSPANTNNNATIGSISKSFDSTGTDITAIYVGEENKLNRIYYKTYQLTFNQSIGESLVVYNEFKASSKPTFNLSYYIKPRTNYYTSVLGATYTFSNNLNITAEYYYQNNGYTKSEWNSFVNYMNNLPSYAKASYLQYLYPENSFMLRQNYFGILIQNINIADYNLYFGFFLNADYTKDHRYLLGFSKEYNKIKLNIEGSIFNSNALDYSTIPYSYSVFARVSYYFQNN